ncbi:MAG: hypothetical protein Q8Q60_00720 [Candidatus Chromulinivorax sp.]|nr:hypothetical protein [Candidatus Chromulinivorax sp.]
MRILLLAVFALILFVLGFSFVQIAVVCLVSYFVYGVLIPAI